MTCDIRDVKRQGLFRFSRSDLKDYYYYYYYYIAQHGWYFSCLVINPFPIAFIKLLKVKSWKDSFTNDYRKNNSYIFAKNDKHTNPRNR